MRKIITIAIIIALGFAGVKLVKKRKATVESASTPTVPHITINTISPDKKTVIETETFTGKAESNKKIAVATKLSGYIKRISKSEDDTVKKGETLVIIDSKEIESGIKQLEKNLQAINKGIEALTLSLEAAKAELSFTENRYNRVKALYQAGGASKEQLEGVETELKLKKIKIKTIEKNIETKEKEAQSVTEAIKGKRSLLRYTTIKSSTNGKVSNVLLKKGDLAVPGKPIMFVLSGKSKITFQFPSKNSIKPGMNVIIKGYGNGTITKIYPETKNGLFVAEVRPEKEIPANLLLTLKVIKNKVTGTTVPLNALIEKENGNYIVVKTEKGFTLLKVTILATDEEKAVIKENINQPIAIGSESKLLNLIAGGEK